VTKGNYGSAMGVFGSLWDTGHAGGPVVFGFLLIAFGYRTSWLIMALVMAAALLVFLFGAHRAPMDEHGGFFRQDAHTPPVSQERMSSRRHPQDQ
jgi:DHA1 family multidrug resistance protein-like MFS transporter